jgi:hypothetical protein
MVALNGKRVTCSWKKLGGVRGLKETPDIYMYIAIKVHQKVGVRL